MVYYAGLLVDMYHQTIDNGTRVETLNGVGVVCGFHSLTGDYEIRLNGQYDWFSPAEFAIVEAEE